MMAWKLATSPTTAASDSAPAACISKMARKPSRIGSGDVPSAKAPVTVSPSTVRITGIDGLMNSTRKPSAISVNMPSMMPFGMSRFGSTDSSAASGNCSMARNSHTANGMAASTP